MKKMKVAVMDGIKETSFVERDIPVPMDDEVLVKLEYVGICGSDLHYYETGAIGDYLVEPPFVLGHEPSGIIVEVGSSVTNLSLGDKVTLEPGKTCGKCEFCKSGRYNLCPDVEFFATPPIDGVFQEYVAHKADLCFKLPENVDTLSGSLIEPLSVGFHAAFQGEAKIGQKVLVTGAGSIGLVSLLALKALGISEIYVVDVMDKRLNKALEIGAMHTLNGKQVDIVDRIKELTNNTGVDLVIDTTGSEYVVNQAIQLVKKGGNIVLVGYSPTGKMNLSVNTMLDKEVSLKSIFRYRHIYPIAIDAVSSGKVNVKDIITNIFDFSDIQSALDESINNKQEIVKAVIKM